MKAPVGPRTGRPRGAAPAAAFGSAFGSAFGATSAVAMLVLMAALAACDRAATPGKDTAAPPPPPPDTATPVEPPIASTWEPAAGPALYVASGTGEVWVVPPSASRGADSLVADSLSPDSLGFPAPGAAGVEVELFSRARAVGSTRVTAVRPGGDGTDGCRAWPVASLGEQPTGWTIGFARGRATLVPLDSIETLAPADSTRLAAELARLASMAPGDTAREFRGLPFVVRSARRFSPAPGVRAVAAEIVRQVPVEATPRQERMFLIAERDSSATARWELAYVERVSGPEETLESTDILAAVLLGQTQPTLVLGRDDGSATAYALLERSGPKRWRLRWSSRWVGGC